MLVLNLFLYLASIYAIKCEQTSPQLVSNVCQSGIREDNTNYIYCARRSLAQIPIFSKNNVVYDELVLTDNRIRRLEAASFARIKVKKIYLNGNPISHIDEKAFAKLENHLEELWLDAEVITPTDTTETESLSSGVPSSIVNYLRNLNTLRLKGLQIKTLGDAVFRKLKKLQILSMKFCSIQHIDANAFDGLSQSIVELYLDGNLLQSIPTEALMNAAFTSLKILGLSQNNIKIISPNSFGLVTSLDYLNQKEEQERIG